MSDKRSHPCGAIAVLLIAATLGLLQSLSVHAQTPTVREGFGPPPPGDELTKLPQTPGAKGDQQRHYYFTDAGREMPYRLYVPRNYAPDKKTPLVVALHGFGGNQDYFFATTKNLQELCEKHGFIFVAPMGYSTSGWYGVPLSIPGNYPRSSKANRPANVPPPAPVIPKSPEEEARERQLSEADVMNVLNLVRKEYNVDSDRIYLMGHSMGGMGTYFLGQKHADIWAAIAPMSSAMAGVDYHWDRLAKVPIHISVGATETKTLETSKEQMETTRGLKMTSKLLVVPDGTHMSMIAPAVPEIFEFFSQHQKQATGAAVPGLEHVLTVKADIDPATDMGRTPQGARRVVVIRGGAFEGSGMKGVILPGGEDWQTTRADGSRVLEARYWLRADDGAIIKVTNRAIISVPASEQATLAKGQLVPWEKLYARSVPEFEAPIGPHDWLNKALFVGTVEVDNPAQPKVITLRFYKVT